jgi:hypothetical protein
MCVPPANRGQEKEPYQEKASRDNTDKNSIFIVIKGWRESILILG